MRPETLLRDLVSELVSLEADHRKITRTVQYSRARAATVEETLRMIAKGSPLQAELLSEAAKAVQAGLYRSAIVAAFAAATDSLLTRIERRGVSIVFATQTWSASTVEELRETHSEYRIAEAAKQARVITKTQMKTYHGLLHRRNRAAHPTGFTPSMDEALGFANEALTLMGEFES